MRRREEDEPSAHLATRIPKPLLRAIRLHCVQTDGLIREFVMAAIREKLARDRRNETA